MANVTVDIQARVVGYEQSIKALQAALAKVDPGSEIGKSIAKAMEYAQGQVKALSKNMFPKASSDTQIDSIIERTNQAGEAIQHVASLLQELTIGDLNFGALGSDITDFKNQISTLERELNTKLNEGILNVVNNSDQLKNVFSELGTDLTKANANTLFEDLKRGAADAAKEVEKAEAALKSIQDKKLDNELLGNKLQGSLLSTENGRKQLDIELKNIVESYDNQFREINAKMAKSMSKLDLKDGGKNLLDSFFQDLNPSNIQDKINNLYKELQANFGSKHDFYNAIFGDGTTDIKNVTQVAKMFDFSQQDTEQIKANLREFLSKVGGELKPEQLIQISRLIDEGSIKQAAQQTIKDLDAAYGRVQTELKKHAEKAAEILGQENIAQQNLNVAREKQSNIDNVNTQLISQVQELTKQNADLQKQISDLRAKLEQALSGQLSNIKNNVNNAKRETAQQQFPTNEADKYKKKLFEVKSAETAIGKLQGVVERWFSIYSAVRMVSNAIKSMISTVKDLDKTITEIAIVTNMSQKELWSQMGDYTKMARDYGASISGVYKVSQLYYQQGLQQNDVMALTAQTLKMARISGLDYAEATDYMTNAIRSFKLEMTDAQVVVDTYSALAASSASSVTEIATAMSKTASSAEAVGSSLQNTAAMISVMIEATRESPENIGSALKSIISRYGELKENKTGIDAEGEEYSLNKVDKALQSVGISIHDAAGEFRDFDDVIMELAQNWNTIDTNTQRYIATIMAGNRQQSRFLALVSSYERLKDLSETAADSEDASQSQFLKTLDSIKYKTQQVQTSLQSLYTETGIEEMIKNTLDGVNNIIQSFINLSNAFNTPFAAVGKFGMQFYNLARIVTTTFGLIKSTIGHQIDLIRGVAVNKSKEAANEEVNIEKTKNQQIAESDSQLYQGRHEKRVKDVSDAGQAAQQTVQQSTGKDKLKNLFSNGRGTAIAGYGLSILGSALSIGAMGMNEETQIDRNNKAMMTWAGSAASGAGMGAMFGPWGMIIGGAIGAITGAIQASSIAFEDAQERAERLTKELEAAKNESIQKKAEYKNLKDVISEYERLKNAQLESAEAMQQYIDKGNQIAEEQPNLIQGYDAEGNAIIDLVAAYNQLKIAREDANTSAEKEADASVKQAQNAQLEAEVVANRAHTEQIIGESIAGKGNKASKDQMEQWREDAADAIYPFSALDYGRGDYVVNGQSIMEFAQAFYGAALDSSEKIGEVLTRYSDLLSDEGIQNQLGGVPIFEQLLGIINAYKEVNAAANEAGKTKATTSDAEKADADLLRKQSATRAQVAVSAQTLASGYVSQKLLADEVSGETSNEQLKNIKNASVLAGRFLSSQWASSDNQEHYFEKEAQKDFDEFNNKLNDFYIYKSKTYREDLDDLVSNQGNYTQIEAEGILDQILGENQTENPIYQAVMSYYTGSLITSEDIVNLATKNKQDKSDIISSIVREHKALYEDLGQTEKSAVVSFYNNILDSINNNTISENVGQAVAKTYLDTWAVLTASENLVNVFNNDKNLQQQAQNLLLSTDFTSMESIQNFINGLAELGITLEQLGLNEDDFAFEFPPNFAIKVQAFGNTMATQMTNFEKDMNSVTKGMDLATASDMANKLNISIKKFRQVGNKFYLDDYKLLEEYYFKDRQKQIDQLKAAQTQELDNIENSLKSETDGMSRMQNFLSKDDNKTWRKELDDIFSDSDIINELSETYHIDPSVYKNQIIDYMNNKKPGESFLKYMQNNFKETYDAMVNASDEALRYTIASNQIKNGDIQGFKQTSGLMEEAIAAAEEKVLTQYAKSRAETLSNEATVWNQKLENVLLSKAKSEVPDDYMEEAEQQFKQASGISESQVQEELRKNKEALEKIRQEEENRDFNAEAEAKWIANGGTSLEDIQNEAARLNRREFTDSENLLLQQYYERFNDDVEAAETAFIQDRLSQLHTSRAEQLAQIKEDLIKQSTERVNKATYRATEEGTKEELLNSWEAIYTEDMVVERAKQLAEEAKAFNALVHDKVQWKSTDPEKYMEQARKEVKEEYDALIQEQAEQWAEEQIGLAQEGRFSEITSETVKKNAALIYDTYNSIHESIANSMISALGDGNGLIKVTETNKSILEKISEEHPDWLKGETVIGSYITVQAGALLDQANKFEQFIVSSFDTATEGIKALAEMHKNQYANSSVEIYNKVAESESFAYEDLLNYINVTEGFDFLDEKSIEDKITELGLAINSTGNVIIQNYDLWIESLKSNIDQLEFDGATLSELNHAKTLLDNTIAARETARKSAAESILKNYQAFSGEDLEKMANALEEDYDELKVAIATPNKDGTYQLNVPAILEKLNTAGISEATANVLNELVAGISDDYLTAITQAVSYQTKGTTKIVDMEKFAAEFNKITNKDLNVNQLFNYDIAINAFTLNNDIIHQYIEAQRKQLEQLGWNNEAIDAYIKDQTIKVAQDAISIDGLLNARTNDERQRETKKLANAIEDYIALGNKINGLELQSYQNQIKALEKSSNRIDKLDISDELHALYYKYNRMSSELIINTLYAGGEDAINVLKQLKPEASADEISSVYNAAINRLNTALSDVENIMVGSLVDTGSKLYQILYQINPDNINADGVVQSAYDMVEVYKAIYAEMTTTAGATTAGLNDAYAKLLTAQDQTNIDITEALKNGSGMSYADFGNLLAKYDIKFEDYMTEHWDTVMRDGFGNIRITDWEGFAKNIFKTDDLDAIKNTDEYMSAFKAYNDGLIELDKKTEKIIQDEITQISNAKPGDQLNLSYLWTALQNVIDEATKNIAPENYSGNVDLANRPIVPAEKMKQVFENFEDDYATLYSESFIFGDEFGENAGVLFTTLTASGEIVKDLADYVQKLYDEADGNLDYMSELDSERRNLMLYGKRNTSYEELGEYANDLHFHAADKDDINYYLQALRKVGANYADGILTLSEDADMIAIGDILNILSDLSGVDLGEEGRAAIQDAVDGLLKDIASLISNGAKGSLTNTNAATLSQWYRSTAKDYGAVTDELDFTETADGLKLTETSLANVYDLMKRINGIKADALLDDIISTRESFQTLTGALREFNDAMRLEGIDKSVNKLKSLNGELSNTAKMMQNIVQKAMVNPDSMNFMSNKLPDDMQTAVNAWENASKAINTLTAAQKNGYIGVQDFYNIVNTASSLMEAAGKEFNVAGKNAATLMREGAENVKVVNGQLTVDISSAGLNIVGSTDQLKQNMTAGINELASAEIAIIDAEIQVLEILAAMEQMSDTVVDIDNDGLTFEIGDIFDDAGNFTEGERSMSAYLEKLSKIVEESDEIKAAFQQFKINGTSLYELLNSNAETWKQVFGSEENVANFMQKFTKGIEGWDLEGNLQSQVLEFMKGLGQDYSIDLGDNGVFHVNASGISYVIDFNDEERMKAARKAAESLKLNIGKSDEEFKNYLKELTEKGNTEGGKKSTLTFEQNFVLKVATGQIDVVIDEKTGEEQYKVGGKLYKNKSVANAISELIQAGAKGDWKKYQDQKQDLEPGETIKGTMKVGKVEIEVKSDGKGNLTYVSPNGDKASSLDDLYTKWFERENPDKKREENGLDFKKWKVKQGITVETVIEISDEDGNNVKEGNAKTDKKVRAAIQDAIDKGISEENIYYDSKDSKSVEVKLGQGVTLTIPKEKLKFDDKGNVIPESVQEYLRDNYNTIDLDLKDTISKAITEALEELNDTFKDLPSENINKAASAFQTLASSLSTLSTIPYDVIKKGLSGLELPDGLSGKEGEEKTPLQIELEAVITKYINGEQDPNELVNALTAIIKSFDTNDQDPNELVQALTAIITLFDADDNPNNLVSALTAFIAMFNSEDDPNNLVKALSAIITLFDANDDPNNLVNALTAFITMFDSTENPNQLVSALKAIIALFDSDDDPNSLVSALTALVTAFDSGDNPNNLVSALSAIITLFDTNDDPNNLVNALTAFIAMFNSDENPNSLVSALTAIIALFDAQDDPNDLVGALSAFITAFDSNDNPNNLVNALSAIITLFDANDDPNKLVNALSALIATFDSSENPNNLVSALKAVIAMFDSNENPNDLVKNLTAIVNYFNKGTGDPDKLVNALTATISTYEPGKDDPDKLVGALNAIVSSFSPGDDEEANKLVDNLKATIAEYDPGTDNPNDLVNNLTAKIAKYEEGKGVTKPQLEDLTQKISDIDPEGANTKIDAWRQSQESQTLKIGVELSKTPELDPDNPYSEITNPDGTKTVVFNYKPIDEEPREGAIPPDEVQTVQTEADIVSVSTENAPKDTTVPVIAEVQEPDIELGEQFIRDNYFDGLFQFSPDTVKAENRAGIEAALQDMFDDTTIKLPPVDASELDIKNFNEQMQKLAEEGDLDFEAIAEDATVGFNQTIKQGSATARETTKTFGIQAVDGLKKDALQEASPSKVTMEIGQYFDEGLEQGITENASKVVETATTLGTQTVEGLKEGLEGMDEQLSELETSLKSHFDTMQNQAEAAVDAIQAKLKSIEEHESLTWSILVTAGDKSQENLLKGLIGNYAGPGAGTQDVGAPSGEMGSSNIKLSITLDADEAQQQLEQFLADLEEMRETPNNIYIDSNFPQVLEWAGQLLDLLEKLNNATPKINANTKENEGLGNGSGSNEGSDSEAKETTVKIKGKLTEFDTSGIKKDKITVPVTGDVKETNVSEEATKTIETTQNITPVGGVYSIPDFETQQTIITHGGVSSIPDFITHQTIVTEGGSNKRVPQATGNLGLAKAQGTLMGELGPELVVSKGRYFVAGQNGAEMVNLDKDAIVFNHLQTEQLLKNGMSPGRGRAVTNERNAASFVTGNVHGGIAMASASAALAQLQALRAMWESLLKASVSDLAGAAGGGGGGGGGQNDKTMTPEEWVETVERWYNLTQEIAKLEKQITHEEALRSKLQSDFQKNGHAYYTSQKESLDALRKQIEAQEELNLSRREYYDKRREALKDTALGQIYTFDEEGQMKFRNDLDASRFGGFTNAMEWYTDLVGFTEEGQARYSNKEKYERMIQAGFGEYMKYDENGKEIKRSDFESEDEWYYAMTKQAYDRIDEYQQATQSLWDEIQQGEVDILKLQEEANKLLEEMRNNQLEVENEVLKAIEDMKQREIDALQNERDALEESVGKFIDGLTQALDKERDMYEDQEAQAELNRNRRRLGILQRSGASASDIAALQSEINEQERDLYFDAQQRQIDAIQEASDKQIERLDSQIDLMTQQLEYQKEFGLLWGDVYQVMNTSAQQIADFIMNGNSEFWKNSPLQSSTLFEETLFKTQQWADYRDDADKMGMYAEMMINQMMAGDYEKYNKAMESEFGKDYDPNGEYKKAFEEEYRRSGDITKASEAGRALYREDARKVKIAARKAEAGNRWMGTGQYEYEWIDDTYHWTYTYSKETIDGVEGWYFESKKKEKHTGKGTKCDKCGGEKKKNTSGSSSGGSSGSNCNDNCTKVCSSQCGKLCASSTAKGANTGKCTTCSGTCEEGCNKTCYGKCDGGCSGGCTGSCGKMTTTGANSTNKYNGVSGQGARGGYFNHGIYELGELGTETVFTAQQTRVLRNNILSNRPSSLISLLKTYNEGFSQMDNPLVGATTSEDNSTNIDKVEINMNVQQISNDYDARRAGEQAMNEIMRIARKTSAANSIRR